MDMKLPTTQVGKTWCGNRTKGNWLKEANRDRDNLAEIVSLSGNCNCRRRNWNWLVARRGKAGISEERGRILYVWLLSGLGYVSVLNDMVLEQVAFEVWCE